MIKAVYMKKQKKKKKKKKKPGQAGKGKRAVSVYAVEREAIAPPPKKLNGKLDVGFTHILTSNKGMGGVEDAPLRCQTCRSTASVHISWCPSALAKHKRGGTNTCVQRRFAGRLMRE